MTPTRRGNHSIDEISDLSDMLHVYTRQYNDLISQINLRYEEANRIRDMMCTLTNDIREIHRNSSLTHSHEQPSMRSGIDNDLDPLSQFASFSEPGNTRTNSGLWGAPSTPTVNRLFNEVIAAYITPGQLNNTRFFDNVSVIPTAEQIDNSVIIMQFRDIRSPLNDRCPISLIPFMGRDEVMQILHCGHVFCRAELTMWFQHNTRCPVCRYDVRDYVREALYHNNSEETKESYFDMPDLELCPEIDISGNTIWDYRT